MEQSIPFQKLFKTSLYASFLIGALAIGTHAIMGSVPLAWLLKLGFYLALTVFLVSLINIGIVQYVCRSKKMTITGIGRYILSFSCGVLLILIFNSIFLHFLYKPTSENPHLIHSNLSGLHVRPYALLILFISLNSIILLIQDLVLLRDKKSKMEAENAELKYQSIESTHQLLKSQIHPHFLFNALNTLKSLIKKQPEVAEEYLLKLSEYLRASMQSVSPELVGLDEELKLCTNYLDLQKMRFDNSFTLTNTIPEHHIDSISVPPFSILSLIENAIKHNKFTTESPLQITLIQQGDRLIVKNNINTKSQVETSSGLGLKNLNSRYKILSGDEIIVNDNIEYFEVSIKAIKK